MKKQRMNVFMFCKLYLPTATNTEEHHPHIAQRFKRESESVITGSAASTLSWPPPQQQHCSLSHPIGRWSVVVVVDSHALPSTRYERSLSS